MKRENKTIMWLAIFIFLLVTFCAIGTYAYHNLRTKYSGSFDVDINSKGVDIFAFDGSKDMTIVANENNFARKFGHNLTATAEMDVRLETTNKSSKFCYEVYVHLPDEQVFEYSQEGRAELLLTVQKSTNKRKYETIINKMDITTKTGTIKIPISKGSNNYLNEISTYKNKTAHQYWKASVILVWFENIDQEINNHKEYNAQLETKRVECK